MAPFSALQVANSGSSTVLIKIQRWQAVSVIGPWNIYTKKWKKAERIFSLQTEKNVVY